MIAKNGVSAAGGVVKLIFDPEILNATPGFKTTLFKLTIIAYAVGGENDVPPTVIGKVLVLPSNTGASMYRY
jgi:hypothetical protein